MNESRLPFFSKPVVAIKAPATTSTFGFRWQDVVTRVEAFAIEATDKVVSIGNCTHEETRQCMTQYTHRMASHLFLLHPGEYVTKVEVSYTERVITAVKLHTSLRVTPWYGKAKGERTVFEASDGLCINALCGKYGPIGCSQLGVVFAPKEMALEGHCAVLPPVTSKLLVFDAVKKSRQDDGEATDLSSMDGDSDYVIRTCDIAPRAIMVKTGETAIEEICVVTAVEYARLVRFPGWFAYSPGEQWLVLADGERIKEIGVGTDGESLMAVAFKTNLHTSHVFGTLDGVTMQWKTPRDDEPASYVCGFEVVANEYSDGSFTIRHLTVLCTRPLTEASEVPCAVKTIAEPAASEAA